MAQTSGAVERSGVAHGALGLPEVLFQSVSQMAPAAAVAFSIPLGSPKVVGEDTDLLEGVQV